MGSIYQTLRGLVCVFPSLRLVRLSVPPKMWATTPLVLTSCFVLATTQVHGANSTSDCVSVCRPVDRPVCGTDGVSYDNICKLHQEACLQGKRVSVDYHGYCKSDVDYALKTFGYSTTTTSTPPSTTTVGGSTTATSSGNLAVCYGAQRDALRDAIIRGWVDSVPNLPWYTPGMSYKDSLSGHFFACDVDRDYKLRPDEMLDCFSKAPFVTLGDQDQLITRTLCIDAMIEDVDLDKDWRLSVSEFTTLLDPMHHLSVRNCSLEGKSYSDGAEVQVECNHCVCATGSWVCATRDCPPSTPASTEKDDYYDYYEDAEANLKFQKESVAEQTQQELGLLTAEEKQELRHLEENISSFYSHHNSTTTRPPTTTTTRPPLLPTSTFIPPSDEDDDYYYDYNDDEDDEEDETPSEEVEDNLLDQYDDLIDRSDLLRDKMRKLRTAIRDIELRRAQNKMKKEEEQRRNSGITGSLRKSEGLSERKQRLLSKLRRDRNRDRSGSLNDYLEKQRRRSQIDNDIWADQWKAKVEKHRHSPIDNHL